MWCWQVTSSPTVLLPGTTADITITFIPIAAKEYVAAMPIRVMGLYDINIPLSGELHRALVTLIVWFQILAWMKCAQ